MMFWLRGVCSRIPLRGRWALALAGGLVLSVGSTSDARAQSILSLSPDVTIALGSGLTVADEDVAVDNQLGIVVLEGLGAIPENADVSAFGMDATGGRLLAFDTTVALAGGLVAHRGDVVRFDGASYAVVFDASAEGVPSGATTDAVSISPDGFLLSFDTTVDLDGLAIADEDLVRWNGSGFSLALDGSAAGADAALDIDGAEDLGGGAFVVSFDTSGSIGGVAFADEDILRFDGSGWSLELDASALDADWAAADLDALLVPEPDGVAMLAVGMLWLALAARTRERRCVRATIAARSR